MGEIKVNSRHLDGPFNKMIFTGLLICSFHIYVVNSTGPSLHWLARNTGLVWREGIRANTLSTFASKDGSDWSSKVELLATSKRSSANHNSKDGILYLNIRGGAKAQAKKVEDKSIRQAFQNFCEIISQSRRHLAAAAAARTVSILTMYPVDTIKTRLHMAQSIPPLNRAGELFRGVQGSLLGQVPYGVLTFGSYEMYKQALFRRFEGSGVKPIFLYAVAAVLGDVTGSGWLCPSEVVKQQMQGGMYATTTEAVSSIWKKNGIKGFYQGYFGGLARDVPFRVSQLTSYELTKNLYLQAKIKQNSTFKGQKGKKPDTVVELSPGEAAICGAIAGTFSAAITAPLDRIKTLLMTESEKYGGSVLACASKIVVDEGVQGLFTGIVPRVVYIAPSVVIFFTVYEQVQQRLKKS